jgi:hypothetical protein
LISAFNSELFSTMPIYEFYCPNNNKIYSFFARSLAHAGKTPRCPDNPRFKMERLVSKFAITGRAKEKTAEPDAGTGMDDARMEAALAEMERDFGGMDTENPDPRQLGRMMRKMSALTGEKMPGQMEEMIRRMEAGEDMDKLESEYGDLLDETGDLEADAPGGEGAKSGSLKERLRALHQRPVRDETLYEMNDYVD